MDDDSLHGQLIRRLKAAGHDLVLSVDVSLEGESDAVHFKKAIEMQRVLFTGNRKDFIIAWC
jgi:hypothetical protein